MFAGIDIKGLSDAEKDAEWEKTKANDPDAREFEKAAIAFFHS